MHLGALTELVRARRTRSGEYGFSENFELLLGFQRASR
jgi:hypothetical protein